MKILVISEHFFPKKGGSVTHVYNLCKELSSMGETVHLITTSDDIHVANTWYTFEGIEIYHLDIPDFFRKERFFPFFLCPVWKKIIRQIEPDIIHFAFGHFAPILSLIFYNVSIPKIWTVHNVPPAEHAQFFSSNIILNALLKNGYFIFLSLFSYFTFNFYNSNVIICDCNHVLGKIKKICFLPKKIIVIPIGCNDVREQIQPTLPLNGKNKNDITILSIAGIVEHKNQLSIIKSVPLIKSRFPNIKVIFIGPIRSERYFQLLLKEINKLGVTDTVKFLGEVNENTLLLNLSECDIYLQPSWEEGFGISVLEAMFFEKPIIGSATGAIPEMLENGCGIVISDPTHENIAQSIFFLLSNVDESKIMANNARKKAESQYSWDRIAQTTLNLYKDQIAEVKSNKKK